MKISFVFSESWWIQCADSSLHQPNRWHRVDRSTGPRWRPRSSSAPGGSSGRCGDYSLYVYGVNHKPRLKEHCDLAPSAGGHWEWCAAMDNKWVTSRVARLGGEVWPNLATLRGSGRVAISLINTCWCKLSEWPIFIVTLHEYMSTAKFGGAHPWCLQKKLKTNTKNNQKNRKKQYIQYNYTMLNKNK